jgi:hypothetical protein
MNLERATGIELHPKFLNLTEQRRYQSLPDSIVAKLKSRSQLSSEFVTVLTSTQDFF